METYYQSKKLEKVLDPLKPMVYINLQDKEKIFKDVYSNFEIFYRLLYEARKERK